MHSQYILNLSCLDQRGIVQRVSGFLADHGCNIIDSAQFGDQQSKLFFMRVHFAAEDKALTEDVLRGTFAELADTMQMNWQLHDAFKKPRVLLMVSKIGHCSWHLFGSGGTSSRQWRYGHIRPRYFSSRVCGKL